ncbi:hypothetical protein EV424DRAFT_1343544 [Suillus variegatus]|nr:hypothetical protein EV424DRAFT_1343544 [Suillus variegatus]
MYPSLITVYILSLPGNAAASYRWRPVTIGGFAYRVTKDIINHWAITNDPEVFPELHKFNPQHWIDDDTLRSPLDRTTADFKIYWTGLPKDIKKQYEVEAAQLVALGV